MGFLLNLRPPESKRTDTLFPYPTRFRSTLLWHGALRAHLGSHVAQKGSLVAPDRLRFDFAQPTAVEAAALAEIESDVNAYIRQNDAVETRLMTPDEAIAEGAMALFGEKSGDEVRSEERR